MKSCPGKVIFPARDITWPRTTPAASAVSSRLINRDWRERYSKVNEHNGWIPRDFWLEEWEKQAIIEFHLKNPLEGYRRLTFMMLDADIVAVSPSSVWRVLSQAGLLSKWKGTGFAQPLAAHQHWHIDVSYLNIGGTFYYLCSILDGFSRFIVNWDIRESMTEADIEIILQGAKENFRKRACGSSRITGRSSLRRTSRSSFGSRV
jgi:transposase InsO family protein